ncbi:MAG: nucleotidyl transferase AbiEii/AbiGii toxin family protein [Acidimicrobiales bacterium]
MQSRRPQGSQKGGQFAGAPRSEANVHLNSPPSEPSVDPDVLGTLRVLARSEIGKDFYLAGGTGLALQIRHRRSNDLDYFIDFIDADHLDL